LLQLRLGEQSMKLDAGPLQIGRDLRAVNRAAAISHCAHSASIRACSPVLPVMDDQENDADERETDEHHDEIPDGHGVLLAGGRTSLV
jgi:hypothetical protein